MTTQSTSTQTTGPFDEVDEASRLTVWIHPGQALEEVGSLSSGERAALISYEATISTGWHTFVEVGNALSAIRDQLLYRETHATFDQYCRERWQSRKSYAYYLLSAAQIVACLSTIVDVAKPACEAQVRPLIGLDEDQVRKVWEKVAEAAKREPLTARLVRRIVRPFRKRLDSAGSRRPSRESRRRSRIVARALEHLDDLEQAMQSVGSAEVARVLEIRRCLLRLAPPRPTQSSPAVHACIPDPSGDENP